MSAKTGFAPRALTALPVATNVNGGRSTSSPACTPQARKANTRASVPDPTPTPWATPHRLAISCSSAAPSGPRTNCCEARTFSIAARISPPITAYCAARSSWGTDSKEGLACGCVLIISNGRAQVYVNGSNGGLRTPSGYNAELPRKHVCHSHQLGSDAEPAQRGTCGASRGGEAAARSYRFESHGMRFFVRQQSHFGGAEQSRGAPLRTKSKGAGERAAGRCRVLRSSERGGFRRGYIPHDQHERGLLVCVSNALQSWRRSPDSFTELSAVQFSGGDPGRQAGALSSSLRSWVADRFSCIGAGRHGADAYRHSGSPEQSNRAFHEGAGE